MIGLGRCCCPEKAKQPKTKHQNKKPVVLAPVLLLALAEENTLELNLSRLHKIQIVISYGIILSQPGSLLGKNTTFCVSKTS